MAAEPPILLDDLVARDFVPASERIPDEFEELKEHHDLVVSSTTRDEIDLKFERVSREEKAAAWSVRLPADAVVGLVGTETTRQSVAEIERQIGAREDQEPERRPWSDLRYLPRAGVPSPQRLIRRIDGTIVVPHYVFPPDGRAVYWPSGYPWHCIGKLWVWKGNLSGSPQWSGTGALVGNRVVLTAGHVVPWGAGAGNWMIKFVPAAWDGSSILGAGVSSYVSNCHGYDTDEQAWDMAVLRLYTPLGWLGYFGAKTYDDDWEDEPYWTMCGYPGAIASGNRPSWQGAISIIDDDSDGSATELEHHGDSSPGNSGGPVFAWWDNGPHVIGAHSGGEEEYEFPWYIVKNNVAAGGSAVVNLIKWGRNNWP